MSNLVGKSPTYVNISYGSEFRNMTIVPDRNYSYSAIEVIEVSQNGSSCESQACWNGRIAAGEVPSPAPGSVYSYVYVNSTMNDSGISSVMYSFNVSKAWISSHGYDPEYVRLYRASASSYSWQGLATSLTGSNSTDYFYSASSPGMSVYAVSYEAPAGQASQPVPAQKGSYLDISILVMAIALIAAAYYALLKAGRAATG